MFLVFAVLVGLIPVVPAVLFLIQSCSLYVYVRSKGLIFHQWDDSLMDMFVF